MGYLPLQPSTFPAPESRAFMGASRLGECRRVRQAADEGVAGMWRVSLWLVCLRRPRVPVTPNPNCTPPLPYSSPHTAHAHQAELTTRGPKASLVRAVVHTWAAHYLRPVCLSIAFLGFGCLSAAVFMRGLVQWFERPDQGVQRAVTLVILLTLSEMAKVCGGGGGGGVCVHGLVCRWPDLPGVPWRMRH